MEPISTLCNSFTPVMVDCAGNVVKSFKTDPAKQQPAVLPVLDAREALTEEQQALVRAKYKELQNKFPHMKPKRLVRKTAEFFKVKLA